MYLNMFQHIAKFFIKFYFQINLETKIKEGPKADPHR